MNRGKEADGRFDRPGLSVTRRAGESIDIGDDVRVQITHISGKTVKVRIVAPQNVPIKRSELSPLPPTTENES